MATCKKKVVVKSMNTKSEDMTLSPTKLIVSSSFWLAS